MATEIPVDMDLLDQTAGRIPRVHLNPVYDGGSSDNTTKTPTSHLGSDAAAAAKGAVD